MSAANIQEKRFDFKQTLALIKSDLAYAFPGIKFSVRSDRHWAALIRWFDGPTESQVRVLLDKYVQQGFDGMTDSSYSKGPELRLVNGSAQKIWYDCDHISTSRRISRAAYEEMAATVADHYGLPVPEIKGQYCRNITCSDNWGAELTGGWAVIDCVEQGHYNCRTLEECIYKAARNCDMTEVEAELAKLGACDCDKPVKVPSIASPKQDKDRLAEIQPLLDRLCQVMDENEMLSSPVYPQKANTKVRNKMIAVDVGSSGKYLIEIETGYVWNIKAYGQKKRIIAESIEKMIEKYEAVNSRKLKVYGF